VKLFLGEICDLGKKRSKFGKNRKKTSFFAETAPYIFVKFLGAIFRHFSRAKPYKNSFSATDFDTRTTKNDPRTRGHFLCILLITGV